MCGPNSSGNPFGGMTAPDYTPVSPVGAPGVKPVTPESLMSATRAPGGFPPIQAQPPQRIQPVNPSRRASLY